ncbi:MAG TPA: glycosyltransferase family 9 protein [Candidatus Krumholzibacteria bacterium]|nr:glycosyltransferase family 9 protein [Candidatus Krumholzibacteria bacterium]
MSAAARALKNRLTTLAGRALRREPLAPEALLALRPRRIVVVRQHNQMGDMVCATPALRAVRETWPGAHLTLVTAPVNVQVVRHNPLLDRVLTFDRNVWRRPGALLAFLRALRDGRPELAIVLASVSFSVTSAALALATGARWVVGGDSRPFGWDLSAAAFSLQLPSQPTLDRHAVEHSLAPLEAVGITTADRSTLVVPSADERAEADRILAQLGLVDGFWALHPGAGKAQNVWPADRFAEVARRAVGAGRRVLVLHGPADAAALAALAAAVGPAWGRDVVAAPPCPVGTAAALLLRCGRFLCNDTGIMHVAGALPVPTLALFGPTDPLLWKPPAPEVAALTSVRQAPDARGGEFGWMETIGVDEVWAAWDALPARG